MPTCPAGVLEAVPKPVMLQQEVGKPLSSVLPVVRVLQFLPYSQHAARHPRDGSGNHGAGVGNFGFIGKLRWNVSIISFLAFAAGSAIPMPPIFNTCAVIGSVIPVC